MTIYNYIFIFLISAAVIEALFWYSSPVKEPNCNKLSVNTKQSNKMHIFLLVEMAILCFVSAVRGNTVGTDMLTYIPRYSVIANTPWNELHNIMDSLDFEIGFVYFCKLISIIDPTDVQIFTIITSIISTVGFYVFIKKYSFLPQLSLLIFVGYGYWTNSFNTVRQYMAISVLLIALALWRKDKKSSKIIALVLTVVAASFHLSSICFVVLYFVKNRHISPKLFLAVLLVAAIILVIPMSVFETLLSLTPYGKYISRGGSGGSILIVLLVIFLFVYIMRAKTENADKNMSLWFWMFAFAIISNVMALKIGLFERIMRIFLVSMLTLIPNSVYVLKKNPLNLCVYLTGILLFSLYFYLILMSSQEACGYVIPYLPFWKQ